MLFWLIYAVSARVVVLVVCVYHMLDRAGFEPGVPMGAIDRMLSPLLDRLAALLEAIERAV